MAWMQSISGESYFDLIKLIFFHIYLQIVSHAEETHYKSYIQIYTDWWFLTDFT